MLQTRNAKRPAQAAVRFAVDAVDEGLLSRQQAIATIDADALDALLHPTFDPAAEYDGARRGVPPRPAPRRERSCSPPRTPSTAREAGVGRDPRAPVHRGRRRRRLPRRRGDPHLRGRQGVARGAGRARDGPPGGHRRRRARDRSARRARCGSDGRCCDEGDLIAIDGSNGADHHRRRPARRGGDRCSASRPCSGGRTSCARSACAPTPTRPRTPARALEFGAEGIGLCRTEHMFMAADRQPKMRAMIMAEDEAGRRAALDELLPLQQGDFEGLFEAMAGLPVTIRLLDPPLHEFLPDQLRARTSSSCAPGSASAADARWTSSSASSSGCGRCQETNPMLGHARRPARPAVPRDLRDAGAGDRARGRALSRAQRARRRARDHDPAGRLRAGARARSRARGRRVARGGGAATRAPTSSVGTMIELPRACMIAGLIAAHADFFSFGTNDLTQAGIGFSRDDVEAQIIPRYIEERILDRSPFADARRARGRAARPDRGRARSRRATRAEARRSAASTGRPGLDRASSTSSGSTTSAARRSGCRSRASRPLRRRSRRRTVRRLRHP